MTNSERRGTYLLRPRLMALDLACAPLHRAFGYGVFLVGSCLQRPDYRDVDVRAILSDAEWRGMFPGLSPRDPFMDPRWEMLCMVLSEHLGLASGLPVDFQFQEAEAANAQHEGPRSALGLLWRAR